MTTICFDGELFACDSAAWVGGVWDSVSKMRTVTPTKLASPLYGIRDQFFCGPHTPDAADLQWVWACLGCIAHQDAVHSWLETGEPGHKLEGERDGTVGVLFSPDANQLFFITGRYTIHKYLDYPVAEGSGREMALGALLAGASSAEALRIVAKRSSGAAGTIQAYNPVAHVAENWGML